MTFMHKIMMYLLLFYSSSLFANVINDEYFFSERTIINNHQKNNDTIASHAFLFIDSPSVHHLIAKDNVRGVTGFSLAEESQLYAISFLSYEKVLFDTSAWTKDNEAYDLQHYIHLSKKSFLVKSESVWLSSGAGITLFESNNRNFTDKKAFSFSLGLHSDFNLNEQTTLTFTSKIFANYLNNKSNEYCNDITCLLAQKRNVWLQKTVALNLSLIF